MTPAALSLALLLTSAESLPDAGAAPVPIDQVDQVDSASSASVADHPPVNVQSETDATSDDEAPTDSAAATNDRDVPLFGEQSTRPAPAAEVLTLAKAIETALVSNIETKIAGGQSKAARAEALSSRSGLLPQVGLNASYDLSFDVPYGRANELNQNFNASLSADQLIFDFGRTRKRWHASRAKARATEQSELATRQAVVLNVRLAFLDVLETRALVEVGRKTLENNERHLAQTEALVEAGTRPTIDLVKLRSEVAAAKASLIQAEGNERVARAELGFAMGQPLSPSVEIAEESFAPLTFETLPTRKLFEKSLDRRPEFASQRATIQASALQLEASEKNLWPALYAGAGLGWSWQRFTEPFVSASIGLRLSWQFFDGLGNRGIEEAARANLSVEELRLKLQEQQIYTAIEEASLNVAAAQSSLEAMEEALLAANELLKSAEERYAAGVGSIIELTDAQFDVAEAESKRVRSHYALAAARANLLQAVGVEAWGESL